MSVKQQKLVYVSEKILADLSSIGLALNNQNQKHPQIRILLKSLNNNQEHNLKLQLLSDEKQINNTKNITKCCKQAWVIFKQQESTTIDASPFNKKILLSQSQLAQNGDVSGNLLTVRNFDEAFSIISMSQIQLQRRIKMQKILRKSQAKYQSNIMIRKLKQIIIQYMEMKMHVWIKQLIKFVNFHNRVRSRIIKKYFTCWLIFHYQTTINENEQKIIKQQYLIQKSNKKLYTKCFVEWKLLYLNKLKIKL